MGFPGGGIPAEDMRIKGQEEPDEQGVRASEQVRLFGVSLQHCTKPPSAVTTAAGPGLAARMATSGQHLCVDVWHQPRPHYVDSCLQSLDRGWTLSPSPSTWPLGD